MFPKRKFGFFPLHDIMKKLYHKDITILKFDIEGFEWALFEDEILKMPNPPQVLAFELHAEQGSIRGEIALFESL